MVPLLAARLLSYVLACQVHSKGHWHNVGSVVPAYVARKGSGNLQFAEEIAIASLLELVGASMLLACKGHVGLLGVSKPSHFVGLQGD